MTRRLVFLLTFHIRGVRFGLDASQDYRKRELGNKENKRLSPPRYLAWRISILESRRPFVSRDKNSNHSDRIFRRFTEREFTMTRPSAKTCTRGPFSRFAPALRHRLIAIETIRSRENFLDDVQFGIDDRGFAGNRGETLRIKFNCLINMKY